jgi:hypothetical protein
MLLLQPVRELPDVITARYLVALLNMFEREQFAVTVAHVTHAKVDAGAIRSGAHHQTLSSPLARRSSLCVASCCRSTVVTSVATTIVVAMVLLIISGSGGGGRLSFLIGKSDTTRSSITTSSFRLSTNIP